LHSEESAISYRGRFMESIAPIDPVLSVNRGFLQTYVPFDSEP
jgi:hypothetical protein